jgi:hypothetical protein
MTATTGEATLSADELTDPEMQVVAFGADLLRIDSARYTVRFLAPPVVNIETAFANSDIDFSGADFTVSATAGIALTGAGLFAIAPITTSPLSFDGP